EERTGEQVTDVHGAQEVALLALEDQAADRARVVHRERAAEDLALQAARAAQADDRPQPRQEAPRRPARRGRVRLGFAHFLLPPARGGGYNSIVSAAVVPVVRIGPDEREARCSSSPVMPTPVFMSTAWSGGPTEPSSGSSTISPASTRSCSRSFRAG